MLLDCVRIESIKGIHPDDIASISVLKVEQATSLFGKKAEGGAVLIVSKANKMPKGSKSITVDTISVDHSVKLRNNSLTLAPKNDVLYVVDDVPVSAEKISILSTNKIKARKRVGKGKSE